MIEKELSVLVPDYLARQRWFGGDGPPARVDIEAFEALSDDEPGLVWALARVPGDDAVQQLLIGLRQLGQTERFLEGKGRAMLGDIDTDDGPLLAYDALVDPELATAFLKLVAPGEDAELVRPLVVEQSNTSVVYDDRLILKLYRRVHDGPNPDIELSEALEAQGWPGVPRTFGTWRRGDRDLAVVREYVIGATDGWHLALTSLRDLYDRRTPPAEAGGDFAPESSRLGALVAEMHVALAEALDGADPDVDVWHSSLLEELRRVSHVDGLDVEGVTAAYKRLSSVDDAGRAIRIHGDLHLGQVLRGDSGWLVLDFEGEPRVPLSERRQLWSPLRDVAGMLRSFHYVASVGLRERGEAPDDELVDLSFQWQLRNRESFLMGYFSVDEVAPLLPRDGRDRDIVLSTFELAKAVYEVEYEAAHRPDWIEIPFEAVEVLLS